MFVLVGGVVGGGVGFVCGVVGKCCGFGIVDF